ncbi:MAG: hypothetical protein ACKO6L_05275, partial [Flavobacteriales bacterium]
MEKNKKSKLLLILVFIILVILLLLYFLVFKTEKPKILDLKIVTYAPLCEDSNASMSGDVSPFFRIYEGDGCVYYPEIKIKRNDYDGRTEGFAFTSEINLKTKESDAEKVYKGAADEKMPILACNAHGADSLSIAKDTTKVRHFFLVKKNDSRVDGKLYFDDSQKLAVHIDKLGAKGDLFTEEQKPDAVNIIILNGGVDKNPSSGDGVKEVIDNPGDQPEPPDRDRDNPGIEREVPYQD